MKKRNRKLCLDKETLRELSPRHLQHAGGGFTVLNTAGPSVCVCGLSLEIGCGPGDFTTDCRDCRTNPVPPPA
jgi:hypothetical protein